MPEAVLHGCLVLAVIQSCGTWTWTLTKDGRDDESDIQHLGPLLVINNIAGWLLGKSEAHQRKDHQDVVLADVRKPPSRVQP